MPSANATALNRAACLAITITRLGKLLSIQRKAGDVPGQRDRAGGSYLGF